MAIIKSSAHKKNKKWTMMATVALAIFAFLGYFMPLQRQSSPNVIMEVNNYVARSSDKGQDEPRFQQSSQDKSVDKLHFRPQVPALNEKGSEAVSGHLQTRKKADHTDTQVTSSGKRETTEESSYVTEQHASRNNDVNIEIGKNIRMIARTLVELKEAPYEESLTHDYLKPGDYVTVDMNGGSGNFKAVVKKFSNKQLYVDLNELSLGE